VLLVHRFTAAIPLADLIVKIIAVVRVLSIFELMQHLEARICVLLTAVHARALVAAAVMGLLHVVAAVTVRDVIFSVALQVTDLMLSGVVDEGVAHPAAHRVVGIVPPVIQNLRRMLASFPADRADAAEVHIAVDPHHVLRFEIELAVDAVFAVADAAVGFFSGLVFTFAAYPEMSVSVLRVHQDMPDHGIVRCRSEAVVAFIAERT